MPPHPYMSFFITKFNELIRCDESNPMPCSFPSSPWDVIISFDFGFPRIPTHCRPRARCRTQLNVSNPQADASSGTILELNIDNILFRHLTSGLEYTNTKPERAERFSPVFAVRFWRISTHRHFSYYIIQSWFIFRFVL
jgi:hypothetical protein